MQMQYRGRRNIMKQALALAVTAAAVVAAPAGAQTAWPAKAVTIVVPFPAGGGTDAFARPLSAMLIKQLGRQVLIDNRGGAGGTLGAAVAARAAPDGYTVFMGAVHHAIAPSVYKKLEYSIEKDFTPIGVVAIVPQVIVANPKLVTQPDLKSFMEHARKNPGKLNYGSAGNGTSHHLAGELFKIATGIDLAHVPYKGAGPALQALIGGQIEVMFDGLGSSAQHIKAGTIKPLAVASARRTPALPDVPTAAEAGVKGYEVSTWYALWAPAGTPKELVDRWGAEVTKALAVPEVVNVWQSQGAAIGPMTSKEMGDFVAAEIGRWAKVAKAAKIQID
jgi:tripartite-type tricarboxylate transporter receptor subunit TctC